jgi:hypothetical protein
MGMVRALAERIDLLREEVPFYGESDLVGLI